MTMIHKLVASTLCLAALAACQTMPGTLRVTGPGPTALTSSVVLQGRVHVPGFRVMATAADLVDNATVSLIDAGGTTRAAGVTDSVGNFVLHRSTEPFSPATGTYFTLLVSKRIGGGPVLTMRTTVRKEASGWTSITGPTIVINLHTTAVAEIDALDAGLAPAETIGVVGGAAFDTVTPFGTYDQTRISAQAQGFASMLAAGVDPGDGSGIDIDNTLSGPLFVFDEVRLHYAMQLKSVTGDLQIVSGAGAVNLPRLRSVGGTFAVFGTSNTSVKADNLQTVGGNLECQGAGLLTSLSLASLRTVGGYMSMNSNVVLTDLQLPSLRSVNGEIQFNGNTAIQTLSLPELQTIGQQLTAAGNDAMTAFAAPKLQTAGGKLELPGNLALQTIDLARLTAINGDLQLGGDSALTTLTAPALTTVNGSLTLGGCSALTTLGLTALTTVTGSVFLSETTALPNLSGLAALQSVGSTLGIDKAHMLTTLGGLSALTSVGTLSVADNAELTSLDLAGLTTVSASLDITDNGKLPTALAEALRDALLVGNPSMLSTISGNLP